MIIVFILIKLNKIINTKKTIIFFNKNIDKNVT